MARWYRLSIMALILLVVLGCGKSSSLEGQAVDGHTKMLPEPIQIRFTKAKDGVITDSATGLEWYAGPDKDTNWNQAKSWTESLTAAGGGWRMPTIQELRAIYQRGVGRNNLDPIFQMTGYCVWSGEMRDASSAWGFGFYDGRMVTGYGLGDAFDRRAFAVRSRK